MPWPGCCGRRRNGWHIETDASAAGADLVNRTVDIGGYIMICAAVFQLFDAVGIVFIGALRGAGDTLWPMVATVALSWGLTVGGGVVAVYCWPQIKSIGPWITASLYVVVLGILMAWRFESGQWRRIDLLGLRTAPPPLAPEITSREETTPPPAV